MAGLAARRGRALGGRRRATDQLGTASRWRSPERAGTPKATRRWGHHFTPRGPARGAAQPAGKGPNGARAKRSPNRRRDRGPRAGLRRPVTAQARGPGGGHRRRARHRARGHPRGRTPPRRSTATRAGAASQSQASRPCSTGRAGRPGAEGRDRRSATVGPRQNRLHQARRGGGPHRFHPGPPVPPARSARSRRSARGGRRTRRGSRQRRRAPAAEPRALHPCAPRGAARTKPQVPCPLCTNPLPATVDRTPQGTRAAHL